MARPTDPSAAPLVPVVAERLPRAADGQLPSAAILVVDEDREHAKRLSRELRRRGLEVDVVQNPALALEHLAERSYDLVVTELFEGEPSGFAILDEARSKDVDVEVIVLTGRGDPASAVEAMRRGALTYLTKTASLAELRAVVARALGRVALERRAVELERRLDARFGFGAIIGGSAPMQRVFERLQQVAATDVTVLLTGETGTGKELVAKSIHQNSRRSRQPFVAVNCAALPDTVVESELFGHEKGAFTGAMQQRKGRFEAAHRGTLFLDEVGDMPLSTQVKLLRALEEREVVRVGSNLPIRVDVRLIAATNADLQKKVRDGTFRDDLYFRLKVVIIQLPTLRERPGDIPLLVERFVREFAAQQQKAIDGVTPEARRVLTTYPWPGNVRELRYAVQHMVVVATTPLLDVGDLPDDVRGERHAPRSVDGLAGLSLEDVERELIRHTLELTSGNREQAAKILKIGERTLYRKIKKFDLGRVRRG